VRKQICNASQKCLKTWEDSINVFYLKKCSPSKEGGMKEFNSKFLRIWLTKKRWTQNTRNRIDNIYSLGNDNKR